MSAEVTGGPRDHPPKEKPVPHTLATIDTFGVKLSAEILAFTERLAENTHDSWARRRMTEGWTWGLETLKAILALGYRVEKG